MEWNDVTLRYAIDFERIMETYVKWKYSHDVEEQRKRKKNPSPYITEEGILPPKYRLSFFTRFVFHSIFIMFLLSLLFFFSNCLLHIVKNYMNSNRGQTDVTYG